MAASATVDAQAPGAPLREFAGAYKETSSQKSVRVIDKDGQLLCELADGLSQATFHLAPGPADDAFRVIETKAQEEAVFSRDAAKKVVGLKIFGGNFVRSATEDGTPAVTSESAASRVSSAAPFPGQRPPRIRPELAGKTGDFGDSDGKNVLVLFERSGRMYLRDSSATERPLDALSFTKKEGSTAYTYATKDVETGWVMAFEQRGTQPVFEIATQVGPYHRLPYSVPTGSNSINIVKPLKGLKEIRAAAMAATPPEEHGDFRKYDLVELGRLDPAIRLDIRYATPNDFLGAPVYTQARAFLQRPASEALLRALHRLQPYGYGLLIHDGYRPWYVTKIFWDATPDEGKIFVADPAQGSRHNRGCAIDLTLYDLKTDQPVEMTGLYDEMSPRSFPDYPGGTSLQRWHRDLLRWAMEAEGFTVYESEWWHFDYKDWREYAIGNFPFEKLAVGQK